MFNYKIIFNFFKHYPGWSSKDKIVVFESDDWGSMRAPSPESHEILKKAGLDMSWTFNQLDGLASSQDLSALFEVLAKYKDKQGSVAKFTAVSVVANPDFERIAASGFSEYYYEPFTTTLKRTFPGENTWQTWKEGMNDGVFVPQFHGREHLNVGNWMRELKTNNREAHLAFEHKFWGYINPPINGVESHFLAAFDLIYREDLEFQKNIIVDGLRLFEEIFGQKATFFVPPNGPYNIALNETAAINGIQFISLAKMQREPQGEGKLKTRYHYLGQNTYGGLRVITRNAFFEPHLKGRDWVDSCLHSVETAFKWQKPAVITSHRVNYIGGMKIENRELGLRELNRLLDRLTKKWPDLIFMSSDELGLRMQNN